MRKKCVYKMHLRHGGGSGRGTATASRSVCPQEPGSSERRPVFFLREKNETIQLPRNPHIYLAFRSQEPDEPGVGIFETNKKNTVGTTGRISIQHRLIIYIQRSSRQRCSPSTRPISLSLTSRPPAPFPRAIFSHLPISSRPDPPDPLPPAPRRHENALPTFPTPSPPPDSAPHLPSPSPHNSISPPDLVCLYLISNFPPLRDPEPPTCTLPRSRPSTCTLPI